MKLYNTLSKGVEDFKPIQSDLVKIYSCGPTVYDSAHIGNLSAYIYADILRRSLNLAGFATEHVMNITDIDDKTARRSRELYPNLTPDKALRALTDDTYQDFLKDMNAVGNDTSKMKFIRATDVISDIQEIIKNLIEKKVAYIAEDGVYFDVSSYTKHHKYGRLSKVVLPENSRARINSDEYDKDSAQDFALWKVAKPAEPKWEFKVDGVDLTGRPGWHIECSTISTGQLGQPFDIHTGGIDLIFPHHENEIAQSIATKDTGNLANYFVHNAHIMVDGEKMSKSKNNFYTLKNLEQNDFSPLDFRMLILQSHYQSPSNFTWESLAAASSRLRNWRAIAELRWQTHDSDDLARQDIVKRLIAEAKNALQNNLDTPSALRFIDQALTEASRDIGGISHAALDAIFDFTDNALGLMIYRSTPNLPESLQDLIKLREVERSNGDYAHADEIRDSLLSQGVLLKDTPIGVIWSR